MKRRLRPRSAYDVVALLALFVALGGISWAATSLPANSVGTEQLKKHAVTIKKISDGARKKLKGQRGPKGDPCLPATPACRGPQGPPGPAALPIRKEFVQPDSVAASSAPRHPIGTVGPYEIGYTCGLDLGNAITSAIYVKGPAGRFQETRTRSTNDAAGSTTVSHNSGAISAGVPAVISGEGPITTDFARETGTAIVSSATGVVTITYSNVAHATTKRCNYHGSAFDAP